MELGGSKGSKARASNEERMLLLVQQQLSLLEIAGLAQHALRGEDLLIEDLCLNSLKFVQLAAGLALALGIEQFPMQEWLDGQLASGRPLSLAELVSACLNVVHPTQS
jgi:hypothetical protein